VSFREQHRGPRVLRVAAEGGLRLATSKCFESIEAKSTRSPTGVRAMHKLRLGGRKVEGTSPTQGAIPDSRQVWRNAEDLSSDIPLGVQVNEN